MPKLAYVAHDGERADLEELMVDVWPVERARPAG
jgi:hypothetical protein